MQSYISSIGIANPEYKIPQMEIAGFMAEAVNMVPEERKRLITLYKASGIKYRYSVIPDFGKKKGSYSFFPNTHDLEPFPTVRERMNLYERKALPLSLRAIDDCLDKSGISRKDITHLITVSCTGMYAPGIDLEIVGALGLSHHVQRTCINYMGCYAAFSALKVADAFCRSDPGAVVLIVCVELCTIHYQKNRSWDDHLSNVLFGDGAAAVIVQAEKPAGIHFSVESFHCDILSEGRVDMAWNISDFGFEMTLSSNIPSLIRNGIRQLAGKLLAKTGHECPGIHYFAIHPGGKKILEAIEEELGIDRSRTNCSFQVLREYGNMSSPSVLFVLHRLLYSLREQDASKNVMGLAFGPGLTLESMMLKVGKVSHVCYEDRVKTDLIPEDYA